MRSVGKNGINPTHLYLTAPELRSNGTVKDEIRKGSNGYELVKRVGVGTLGSELMQNPLNFTNGWIANGNATIVDADTISSTGSGNIGLLGILPINKFVRVRMSGTTTSRFGVTDGLNTFISNIEIGSFSVEYYAYTLNRSPLYLSIRNAGETTITEFSIKEVSTLNGTAIGSVTVANTAILLGSNIHYTLATPVITPISYGGVLNSAENGTVYHEPIIADAGVYDTKMDILLTDYPIATIDEIIKHENGLIHISM